MASSSVSSALLPPLNTVVSLIVLSCFISTSFSLREISDHKPNAKPLGFSARVIHRDSPESPFYDPNLTDADRLRNAIQRSFERYNHYTSKSKVPNDMQPPVTHRTFSYVVSYQIGTPRVDTYSVLDTGSDLTWLQCRPCDNCYRQEIPIYDPRKSTSYAKIGCNHDFCKPDYHSACDKDGICRYQIGYGFGHGQSQGTLSTETFTFVYQSENKTGLIPVYPVPFGCGTNNSFPYLNDSRPVRVPGVFGLNKAPLSWLYQLSIGRFSHCLVPKDWHQTSMLRFKDDAIITNETTPMVNNGQFRTANYYVSLEGISVGKTRLNIPKGTFELKPDWSGGVIVDSGSGTTHLPSAAFDPLVTELVKRIKLERVSPPPGSSIGLCYRIHEVSYKLVPRLPAITFHFRGLDFVLQNWTVWLDFGVDVICLTLFRSKQALTLVGAQHLQNVNVGYDLENEVISLRAMVCTQT
ncbi:hypothetical protein MKW94_004431 [Papaver nudicaule]|uniref:Peptidase A1 domain-containing protein n=1 Tax=Papaver nudicaule TaxID=74823 RepID=A0AA41V819_PAPNU|nr:hypothetical protein [Papaver nudicaule]